MYLRKGQCCLNTNQPVVVTPLNNITQFYHLCGCLENTNLLSYHIPFEDLVYYFYSAFLRILNYKGSFKKAGLGNSPPDCSLNKR